MHHRRLKFAALALSLLTAIPFALATSLAHASSTRLVNNSTSTGAAAASWDTESEYWREHYPERPYYSQERNYSTVEPAYRYGVESFRRYEGRPYDKLDPEELEQGWVSARGKSSMDWSEAQSAMQDAYTRMYNSNNRNHGSTNTDQSVPQHMGVR